MQNRSKSQGATPCEVDTQIAQWPGDNWDCMRLMLSSIGQNYGWRIERVSRETPPVELECKNGYASRQDALDAALQHSSHWREIRAAIRELRLAPLCHFGFVS